MLSTAKPFFDDLSLSVSASIRRRAPKRNKGVFSEAREREREREWDRGDQAQIRGKRAFGGGVGFKGKRVALPECRAFAATTTVPPNANFLELGDRTFGIQDCGWAASQTELAKINCACPSASLTAKDRVCVCSCVALANALMTGPRGFFVPPNQKSSAIAKERKDLAVGGRTYGGVKEGNVRRSCALKGSASFQSSVRRACLRLFVPLPFPFVLSSFCSEKGCFEERKWILSGGPSR